MSAEVPNIYLSMIVASKNTLYTEVLEIFKDWYSNNSDFITILNVYNAPRRLKDVYSCSSVNITVLKHILNTQIIMRKEIINVELMINILAVYCWLIQLADYSVIDMIRCVRNCEA